MRLHLFHELDVGGRPHGCSYIRLLQPYSHPSIAEKLTVSTGDVLPHDGADVAIVERLWLPGLRVEHAEHLLELLAQRGVRMIYTLDDNLLDLNNQPGIKNFPTVEQKQIIRLFAQEADKVIVSTVPLAERMNRFNPNVIPIANQLDEQLFERRPRKDAGQDKVTFGYMGTLSHLEDLLMILAPLRRVLNRFSDRVRFEIVGIAEPDRMKPLFDGLPVRYHRLNRKEIEYPGFVQWIQENISWDFAIAPLADTAFNQAKSDLKVLDYGILGIPGIFSRTPSYRDTVQHEENGLCVANEDAAWEEAISLMIEDRPLRQRCADKVAEQVWNSRTLAQHAHEWLDAVK